MPPRDEKLTLTEEVFRTFTKVSRWATSGELTADPGSSQRRGCANPLSLLKILVFLLLLVLLPLFVLPMFLARLAQAGRRGFRYGATVDVTSGEQARWSHDMMRPVADAGQIAAGTAAIASHDPGFRASVLTDWAAGATALICQSLVSGGATATRTFMADGLYRTHQALLELLTRAGISCAGSWRAVDAAPVEASRSPLVDEVRIRVTCQGWRWERHEPTGVTLRGGPDPATWSET